MPGDSTPDTGIADEARASDPRHPAPGHSSKARGKAPRGKARSRRHKALLVAAWTASGVLVLGGTGVGYLYFRLNHNIKGIDIDRALGTDRPPKTDNGSENILVLGSDTRSGSNRELGGGADDGSARSDTAMIVHLYKGHKRAAVVSLPRDTLVDRPECTDGKGTVHPAASSVMFNSAYSTGGAVCAVKTVESITGIRMDHYIEVDFSGFQKLVDGLGGVRVTTTKDIDDQDSHLSLKAGTHTLDGRQALGLVRTRHGVGDGSDLGRIQLQQAFIKALADQIDHIGVLTSPDKLYDLADTATKAVTTDSDLASVKDLASFAGGLKGIGASHMNTVTTPVRYDPADPDRVILEQAKAQQVWNALKNDKPVPASATKGTATGAAEGVVTLS